MLRAGDWIEVRGKDEILKTLDKQGRLEGLPFMPQMFSFCGRRFQVFKRAHKTCDTVDRTGGRSLPDTVHLDLRCDGKAYGGCQAACLIFWKEAWLKAVDAADVSLAVSSDRALNAGKGAVCTEDDVWKAVRRVDSANPKEIRYACQATELPRFTTPLPWWDLRQYVEDYTSGNTSLGRIVRGALYAAYYNGTLAYRDKIGRPARWLYDVTQSLWQGVPFPRKKGRLPDGRPATDEQQFEPGDVVRIKSYDEILSTLDRVNKLGGLFFDAEMVPFCGGTYRVRSRVKNFLNEKTGKLVALKAGAVMLENVWCQSRYSDCRMFCPRAIYPWWREEWLEKVSDNPARAVDGRRQMPDAA